MPEPRSISLLQPLILCLLALPALPSAADASGPFTPHEMVLSAGAFGVDADDDTVAELGVELVTRGVGYRLFGADRRLELSYGVMATQEGSLYGYSGFRFPFELNERWTLTPQLATGLYEEGDGVDLGGLVEFRSGIELAARVGEGHRLGLMLYHLSNAGLYDSNPGIESVVVTWSWRLGD
jgi:hypothetical protein